MVVLEHSVFFLLSQELSWQCKPDDNQVMTDHEDLDSSPSQRLVHSETSENGDVDAATLSSPSVTQSEESDDDSLSTDSQITARPQFRNDSTDLDTARGLSQSYETESTQEQVVGNLATAELNRHRIVVFAVTSNFSWATRNSLRTETGTGSLAPTQDY